MTMLLTKTEAAKLAGVSVGTLRKWATDPSFPTFTPPGGTRAKIPVDAFRAWIDGRTAVAA